MDITRRPSDTWIIDFGEMTEAEACLYEAPFEYVRANIKPLRAKNRDRQRRENWWRLGRSGSDLKTAIRALSRFIVTPRVAKYRLFVWTPAQLLPDCQLVAVALDDDATIGILHSRFHELWALRLCTWLGVGNDPRYTPSTTFETFPFPQGMTPNIPAAQYADDPRAQKIATAAKRLDELRNNWLNPLALVMRIPEVVKGYPNCILPKDEAAAQVLKKRTLTNLYNERPAWLDHAHRKLDEAVAEAYGWQRDMSDDEILTKLLALNLERVKASSTR
jgi:type II restriction/modification system DNA methylase subunit YeeA